MKPVHFGRALQLGPGVQVGFSPDGEPTATGPAGLDQQQLLALVLQRQQQVATDMMLLTLWLRQAEANSSDSRIVAPPAGLRLARG